MSAVGAGSLPVWVEIVLQPGHLYGFQDPLKSTGN